MTSLLYDVITLHRPTGRPIGNAVRVPAANHDEAAEQRMRGVDTIGVNAELDRKVEVCVIGPTDEMRDQVHAVDLVVYAVERADEGWTTRRMNGGGA